MNHVWVGQPSLFLEILSLGLKILLNSLVHRREGFVLLFLHTVSDGRAEMSTNQLRVAIIHSSNDGGGRSGILRLVRNALLSGFSVLLED